MDDMKALKVQNRKIKRNLIRFGKLFNRTDTSKIAEKAGVTTVTVRSCLRKGERNDEVVKAAKEVMKEKIEEAKAFNEGLEAIIKEAEENGITTEKK